MRSSIDLTEMSMQVTGQSLKKKKNPNTIVNRPHQTIMMREPQEGE